MILNSNSESLLNTTPTVKLDQINKNTIDNKRTKVHDRSIPVESNGFVTKAKYIHPNVKANKTSTIHKNVLVTLYPFVFLFILAMFKDLLCIKTVTIAINPNPNTEDTNTPKYINNCKLL